MTLTRRYTKEAGMDETTDHECWMLCVSPFTCVASTFNSI